MAHASIALLNHIDMDKSLNVGTIFYIVDTNVGTPSHIKRIAYSIISPHLLRRMHVIVAGTERWRRGPIQSAHTWYGCKWRSGNLNGSTHHVARGTPPVARVKMNENFLLATFLIDRFAGWIFVLDQTVPNRNICQSQTSAHFGHGQLFGLKVSHRPTQSVIGQNK